MTAKRRAAPHHERINDKRANRRRRSAIHSQDPRTKTALAPNTVRTGDGTAASCSTARERSKRRRPSSPDDRLTAGYADATYAVRKFHTSFRRHSKAVAKLMFGCPMKLGCRARSVGTSIQVAVLPRNRKEPDWGSVYRSADTGLPLSENFPMELCGLGGGSVPLHN
jgi:hypothetical protein